MLLGCSANWKTFQANNNRTGFTDRPEVIDPEIKWKTYIGIQGYLNNSVIASDKVFVGSSGSLHNQPDSLDGIYCLNKRNGKVIWHFKTHNDAAGLAYSQNKIYTTGDDGYLRCLKAKNGLEIWHIKRDGAMYSQPLIINDLVIAGDESGNILFVNKNSGKINIEKKVANSNVRGGLSSDGKNIYATFVEGVITCLDLNGNIIWRVKGEFSDIHGEDFESIYGAPTITGDQLIVPFVRSTYYNKPAVYSFNKINGELLWRATDEDQRLHGNVRSSVAVWNDYIFYGCTYANSLVILSLKDGKVVDEIPMGEITDPHWSSPIIANNTLYLGRYDGGFNAIGLEQKEVIWQLYIGDHENIERRPKDYGSYGAKHASIRNQIFSVFATPSIDKKGTVFIGSGEGWLYAIGNKKSSKK